jgi:hypothetical protein
MGYDAKRHRHIHPVLSYAFLLSAGALSLNGALTAAEPVAHEPPAAVVSAKPASHSPDLASLKSSSAEFSAQLSVIKIQVNELAELGYPPPQELMDAIGEGEQLTAMISQATSAADLDGIDAGTKLRSIGARIRAHSGY